jgi:hypothetical protein
MSKSEGLEPVSGTFEPGGGEEEIQEIEPHVGFNLAWQDALRNAESAWHKRGEPPVQIPVTVELRARIDIWNPGGIGQYHVILTPVG